MVPPLFVRFTTSSFSCLNKTCSGNPLTLREHDNSLLVFGIVLQIILKGFAEVLVIIKIVVIIEGEKLRLPLFSLIRGK